MAAVIEASRHAKDKPIGTGESYDFYKAFCNRAGVRVLTGRAFGDFLMELDMYSLIRSRIHSRGRYGRTREILLGLPDTVIENIYKAVLENFDLGEKSF